MNYRLLTLSTLTLFSPSLAFANTVDSERPNILFCLADDVSYPFLGAYGCSWVKTPNCDWVASKGLTFNNAYTPNSKSAPSRSMIITGRYSWQLEDACNHFPFFPTKFKTVAEELEDSGYFVGNTGKAWSPGEPGMKNGKPRELIGRRFNNKKLKPITEGISDIDYAANFEAFLAAKCDDEPFFFWYGSLEPHRNYDYGTGSRLGGYRTEDIDRIPSYWRDCDSVRNDMLDFALELEHFDDHVGLMIETLRKRGELDNTIIIITADNGMPFPRIKGQAYYSSNHLPFIVMWGDKIKNPGRIVDDYISFVDLTPTFLDLAGVDPKNCGMKTIEGESILPVITSSKRSSREYVLVGKERHDIGRPNDWGYPIRGIKTDDYLYVHNFEIDRWPSGDPETGYLNCDAGATKSQILKERELYPDIWQLNFGKRPTEELYDLRNDPDCMINLANDKSLRKRKASLKKKLFEDLRKQGDPRVLGKGEVFDNYQYSDSKYRNYYNRIKAGEIIPTPGWIDKSDEQNIK